MSAYLVFVNLQHRTIGLPKSAYICDKIARNGQNGPKFSALYAKSTPLEKSTPPVVTNISYDCPQNSENFFLKNLIHMTFEQQLNLDSHTSEEHNLGQGILTFCRGI